MSWPRVKDSTAPNHITGWKGEMTSPWDGWHSRALHVPGERMGGGVDSCGRFCWDWREGDSI